MRYTVIMTKGHHIYQWLACIPSKLKPLINWSSGKSQMEYEIFLYWKTYLCACNSCLSLLWNPNQLSKAHIYIFLLNHIKSQLLEYITMLQVHIYFQANGDVSRSIDSVYADRIMEMGTFSRTHNLVAEPWHTYSYSVVTWRISWPTWPTLRLYYCHIQYHILPYFAKNPWSVHHPLALTVSGQTLFCQQP